MSQTTQQVQDAATAAPTVRKSWELFWRIIATLMIIIIGWIGWVLYQITPRSVVTPLVYASQVKPIGMQAPAIGGAGTIASLPSTAVAPAAQAGAAEVAPPQPSPEAAAAALAMEQAQAAVLSGAHQPSADVQAAAMEERAERLRSLEQRERERLKLAPEITTPLTGKRRTPQ